MQPAPQLVNSFPPVSKSFYEPARQTRLQIVPEQKENFCVYGHRDDAGVIFYIGAGCPDRPYQANARDRSEDWRAHVAANCASGFPEVIMFDIDLDVETSHQQERFWIKYYGRRIKGEGPLVNWYEGGSGVGKYVSDETREKLRAAAKGVQKSPETKAKTSAANKGRKMTPEQIAKGVESRKRNNELRKQQQRLESEKAV